MNARPPSEPPAAGPSAAASSAAVPAPQQEVVRFDQLGLDPLLLRAIKDEGYDQPTPIQERAIPPALAGRDVVGCAQTGTGKTAAFALPLLQLLNASAGDEPSLRALVLTPTRELAAQVGDSLSRYGRHLELWHTVIFGGVSDKKQIRELRQGVDALVATPGRLLDLCSRGEIDLRHIELFVLDEADRMLDMGFLPDVRRVTQQLPDKRHTLFFSATMPPAIRTLADGLLRDPVAVNAARVSAPAEGVRQQLYFVDKANKKRLLVTLLKDAGRAKTLVFSRTKHGANRIVRILDKAGVQADAIHGNKSQNARVRALERFRRNAGGVLVATDIAARGIDVDGITHVINFELPNVPETYVHRIGRTARAGATGVALSFCDVEERPFLVDIERLLGEHIERVQEHSFPATQPPPPLTELSPGRRRQASGKRNPRKRRRRRGRSDRRTAGRPGPRS